MKFISESVPFGKFNVLKLMNSTTGEYLSLIPGFGGKVNELVLSKDNLLHSILDEDKTPEETMTNRWYKGAKMTPFPGRVKDGKYVFYNREYVLPVNFPSQEHAIHGLIYNREFKVKNVILKSDYASVSLELLYDGDVTGYPFPFYMEVQHKLEKGAYTCQTTVKNNGKDILPFGDGWHPYFKTGTKADDLYLKLPPALKILEDERQIPTTRLEEFEHFSNLKKIEDTAFDTGFVLVEKSSRAETEIHDPVSGFSIICWQETGILKYDFLQVFIPPGRETIAIEPMTCAANAFNNNMNLNKLQPGSAFEGAYGLYLK